MAPVTGSAVAQRQENWPAITSLVLGIASVATPASILAAPFAIAFGIAGRRRAGAGAPHGGLATAGLVLGLVALLVVVLVFLLFFGLFSPS